MSTLAEGAVTTVAEGNFLIPDATFIAELVAFIVILYVIWKYAVPPIQKNLSDRQEEIRKGIEDSKAAHERLQSAEEAFSKAVSEARTEAAKIREEAHRLRTQTIEGAKDEARKAAEAVTQQAEERLALQYRLVSSELRRDIGRLAVELAGRIVGESLTDEELQRRVIDRFLAELEAGDHAADAAAAQPESVR